MGFARKEEEDEGDQSLAVKPFLGTVKNTVPSSYKQGKNAGGLPDGNLVLKRAHGFGTQADNARFTSDGKVVYTTAALGVIQDIQDKDQNQEFFSMHGDDITCMA